MSQLYWLTNSRLDMSSISGHRLMQFEVTRALLRKCILLKIVCWVLLNVMEKVPSSCFVEAGFFQYFAIHYNSVCTAW